MLKYLKNNLILIIISIILIIVGVFCILVRGSDIIRIFSYIALIYLIVIGGWMIFSGIKYKKFLESNTNLLNKPIGYIVQGSVFIILGVLIVIFPSFLVRLAIGLLLIILPLITLITQEDKKRYLKNNFWKFIVGLLFVIAVDVVLDILFIIIGACLLIVAGLIIYLLVINHKDPTKPNLITKYIMMYIIKKNSRDNIQGE